MGTTYSSSGIQGMEDGSDGIATDCPHSAPNQPHESQGFSAPTLVVAQRVPDGRPRSTYSCFCCAMASLTFNARHNSNKRKLEVLFFIIVICLGDKFRCFNNATNLVKIHEVLYIFSISPKKFLLLHSNIKQHSLCD